MTGQVVVITGGNSGIGREAAASLAGMGAIVVLTARNQQKGSDALDYVRTQSGTDTSQVMELDLGSFASIRAFADEFLETYDRLDVLINNAGGILSERRRTSDGFEMTFGVNHLGHFLLTDLLLDRIKASAPARIINVASLAHRLAGAMSFSDLQHENGYSATGAYNESKLANVLFTRELARRLDGSGVTVNCCHPGPVRTGFGSADDTKGIERIAVALGSPFMIGPRRGSDPLVLLASSPQVTDVTGEYFSRRPMSGFPGAKVKAHRVSKYASDPAAEKLLWEESEKLIESVES